MESERFALAALLWTLVGAGLWLLRRRSPFYLPTVALIATGLVGSFFPLATLFVEPASWRNLHYLSPRLVVAAQLEYVAFAAGLLAALWIAMQLRWLAARAPQHGSSAARDGVMAAGLVAVGLALYGAYAQRVGVQALFDREDYASKYLASQGLGPLQFGLPMAIAGCLWAEASDLSRTRKNLFLPIGAAIGLWSLAFISVRTNFVVLALGYGSIVAWRQRYELRRVRISLLVLLAGLYLLLETFALFRGAYKGDVGEALWMLSSQGERAVASAIGGSELSHPFITTGEILYSREAGELAGRSLIDGVLACAPRGLYPDRPLMLSEQFVRANYAELASRGGGAAFSLVAEAWLDFGTLLGPLLFGLAFGLLFAWAERRRDLDPSSIVGRTLPYFVFYVAMQHRNEFATLFKQLAVLTLVVVPLWIAAEAAATVARSRRVAARA